MTPKVPTNERGTAMLGMDVAQILRRKKKTTKMTRVTEIMRVTSISWTEARIVIVRSCETLIWMDGGIEAYAQLAEEHGVDFYADRGLRTATDVNLTDTIDLCDFLSKDRIRYVEHLLLSGGF